MLEKAIVYCYIEIYSSNTTCNNGIGCHCKYYIYMERVFVCENAELLRNYNTVVGEIMLIAILALVTEPAVVEMLYTYGHASTRFVRISFAC